MTSHTRATPGVYAIDRSSRVFSGFLLWISILPPRCSCRVRSVASITRAPGSASTASRSRGQSEESAVSTVMSRIVYGPPTATRRLAQPLRVCAQ